MTESEIAETIASLMGETPERIRTVGRNILAGVRGTCPQSRTDVHDSLVRMLGEDYATGKGSA